MLSRSWAVFGLLAPLAARATPVVRTASGDAPFSLSPAQLESAIICPRGITGAAGGVILLVPGTASQGSEEWPGTPYDVLLPNAGPKYDICWPDFPDRSLGDAQVTAEYIAWNVPLLAAKSATKKISIIGHSQGAGLNPQWALSFWPSTRAYVSQYVAIAGDFHGTVEGPLACTVDTVLTVLGGCAPAILQQTKGSKYLAAQNQRGGEALVPTTSIYTRLDDIIQDEIIDPTSNLPGAKNIALQDLNICGPLHIADHFTIIVDPAAYALTLAALTNNVIPFEPSDCNFLKGNTALDLRNLPALLRATVNDNLALFTSYGVQPLLKEPPLKKYVCDQGQAITCGSQ